MSDTEKHKEGPKWTNDRFFDLHEDALKRIEELNNVVWADASKMQAKIRLRGDGRFLVKCRKKPELAIKESKSGDNNRKNKRNSKSRKFDTEASV